MLRDIPPFCSKQSLGLVLLASPFPPRRSWAKLLTNNSIQAPSKYLQSVPCQASCCKNPGNSRDSTTGNSIVSLEKASPRSRGAPEEYPEVPAHTQPPQAASTMHCIPWQPFSCHFPLPSPGWQLWDSSGAALADSSSFLALLSFSLCCTR